ncbi:MAG: hypothetical protein OEW15_13015 [Nitrospirota bacterium]|nr:hypothetical protein [Nitrospirota bacterium]
MTSIILLAVIVAVVLPTGVIVLACGQSECALVQLDVCHQGNQLQPSNSMPSLTEPIGTLVITPVAGPIDLQDTILSDNLFSKTQYRPPRS